MQFPGAEPTVEHHLAVTAWGMHPDRIGVGVEADQEKINGGTATEAVFNRLTEIEQALMTRRCRQFVIAAMGSAALMGGCLLYTSPSPRDGLLSRMPSSA